MSRQKSDEEEYQEGADPEVNRALPDGPTIDTPDDECGVLQFGYSTRGPDDWVIGGPLGLEMAESNRPGRWFETWHDAEAWANAKYGTRLKGRKAPEPGDTNSWAFIIRGPRGAVSQ